MSIAFPSIVLFGDSITQYGGNRDGWGTGLAEAYQRRADVINRGHGGYNTRWSLHLFDRLFAPFAASPPALVTVFFGANDAAHPDRVSRGQYVPLDEFKSNLSEIVRRIKALGVKRVIVIGPPPVYGPARIEHVLKTKGVSISEPERTDELAGEYSQAASEVASSAGVPFVETWGPFHAVSGWETRLLSDGLHLSPAGNDRLLSLLQESIEGNFPELVPDRVRFVVPAWADFVETPEPIAELDAIVEQQQKNVLE